MYPKTATSLRTHVQTTYDAIAQDFSQTRQTTWPDFEFFKPYIPASARILDAGCGNGRLLHYFTAREFKSYLGIDNSKNLLKHARKEYSSPAIAFQWGDTLDLKVKSHEFNAVFSIAVLHHIPSRELQKKALAELGQTLSGDGLLFLSVWNVYRWKYFPAFVKAFFRMIFTAGDYSWKDLMIPWGAGAKKRMRYVHAFTEGELLLLLKECGFEIEASQTTQNGKAGNHMIVARPYLASRVVRVMDVPFHAVTANEAVQVVQRFLTSGGQHQIVTPNPEILLKAAKDSEYLKILQKASLSIADGVGILWAARFVSGTSWRFLRFVKGFFGLLVVAIRPQSLRGVLPYRLTGTDLMEQLIHQSYQIGAKVFLLGAGPGVAESLAEKWRFDPIVGTYAGSPSIREEKNIIDRINASGANMVFVAYGAPAQEQWIDRNLKKMTHVKVAMGVGGAFDFFTGVKKRAPQWMQKMGLEWLWRLKQEPRRIGRILNATVRFPLAVMGWEERNEK
ncbi:MAG: WecB/TagA/CpsF family glycosyltransferase [Candidatus Gracilibacteria bacterium]